MIPPLWGAAGALTVRDAAAQKLPREPGALGSVEYKRCRVAFMLVGVGVLESWRAGGICFSLSLMRYGYLAFYVSTRMMCSGPPPVVFACQVVLAHLITCRRSPDHVHGGCLSMSTECATIAPCGGKNPIR